MGNITTAREAIGSELSIDHHHIRIKKFIGEGGYSYVFVAEDDYGQLYALKRILAADRASLELAREEIALMQELHHENIIGFFGSLQRNVGRGQVEIFVLMEYCSAGSLYDLIQNQMPRPFRNEALLLYFLMICRAVNELHSMSPPVAHRDIKLENVLLTDDGSLKLCDFGSCTARAKVYKTTQEIAEEEERIRRYSTASYRAPEMVNLFRKVRIDERVDIWAMGCILYMMAFFLPPFQDGSKLLITSAKYKIPDNYQCSEYVVQLIQQMLSKK